MTNQKIIKCYKFVTKDLRSKNGDCQWVIGKWQTVKGQLNPCHWGLHASRTPLESLQYTYGDRWFMAEARGEIVEEDDKFCAYEMRLIQELPVDKILVQFAILCARRCYKNYKAKYPDDKVVIAAIEAAERCWADPTPENVAAAGSAGSAAWSAGSAAESAARSAESAAWSAGSAAWSAGSAAESAAWSAESAAWSAESAAESAARSAESAEKRWQQRTLQKLIHKYTKTKRVPSNVSDQIKEEKKDA